MSFSTELVLIIQVLFGLIAWLGKRTLDRLEESQDVILKECRLTNGSVIRLDQEMVDHNIHDNERFATIKDAIKDIVSDRRKEHDHWAKIENSLETLVALHRGETK